MDAAKTVSPADVVGRLVHESEQMRAVHALVDRTLRERGLEGEWTIRLELHTRPVGAAAPAIAPPAPAPVVVPTPAARPAAPVTRVTPGAVTATPVAATVPAKPRAVAVPAAAARKPVARAKSPTKPGEPHAAPSTGVTPPRATARVATLKES